MTFPNPLTGFSGFPRAPAQEDLQTRRAIQRLAATVGVSAFKSYVNVTVPGGNTITNTVTETAFASSYTFPANTASQGNVVQVSARGLYSEVGPPTLRLKVKLGSVTLMDTGVVTLAAVATAALWTLDATLVFALVGASGTVEAQGLASVFPGATVRQDLPMTNAAVISLDTTPALALTVTAKWGTASASNTITLRQLLISTLP